VDSFSESSIDIALKLGNFVNISEFVIVGTDVPVPPLRVGNMFASQ